VKDDDGVRWCDNRAAHRRPEPAERVLFCTVEGHEYDVCGAHWKAWVDAVRSTSKLAGHCPNCSALITGPPSGQPQPSTQPLIGAIADAIDHAMFRAGILIDKRQLTLRYLAEERDPYVGTILRSTSRRSPSAV
jgi:hypothetical protein